MMTNFQFQKEPGTCLKVASHQCLLWLTMVTIEELLKGIIIVSGNDACVAIAEAAADTESFVDMNEKAAELE